MSISSVLLDNRPGAFQPTFSPLPVHDTNFFDEGPRVSNAKSTSTSSLLGSMDTRNIDAFAQGVEITRQSRYDAGVVKIWSGEAGHRLQINGYGMDRNFVGEPVFAELDLFNPITYLRAQELESTLWFNTITFPIITGDNDQIENYNFNGVIEPLTIRPIVAFFSTEVPFESHTVRGSVMGGNLDQSGASEQVLTVDYFAPTQEMVGYLDMVDMFGNQPLNGFFRHEFTPLLPFSDQRLVRNRPPISSEEDDIVIALSPMTGSTDNYVKHNQRSATCGWYYDNNTNVGTDSLTFGGMTY